MKKKEKNEKAERGVKNAKARNKGRKAAVNNDPEGLPEEEGEFSEKNVELSSSEKLLERKSELSRVRSVWSQTGRMFDWEGAEQREEKEDNERERQEETPEKEKIQSFDKKANEEVELVDVFSISKAVDCCTGLGNDDGGNLWAENRSRWKEIQIEDYMDRRRDYADRGRKFGRG